MIFDEEEVQKWSLNLVRVKATFPQNMVFDEQLTRVSRLRYLSWTTKHANDEQANETRTSFRSRKGGKI